MNKKLSVATVQNSQSGGTECPSVDKQAIALAFGRAAKDYDKAAFFQRLVGGRLLAKLPSAIATGTRVLDLGCGTGFFSQQISSRGLQVDAVDLSPEMLEQARLRCGNQVNYILADAEALPMADSTYDIAFSSLALQWCDDLATPLKELKRVVKHGGLIVFTTLVEGSLDELTQAWQQVDQYQHVNSFLSQKAVKVALAQAGCMRYDLEFSPITLYFNSAVELMRDLKGIGATHLQQGRKAGLAGRKTILDLESAYNVFRHENGQLPATYQVCFGVIIND